MSFGLQEILKSKRALRRELAARPLAEKLRMLDALRERTLTIRLAKPALGADGLREQPPPYGKEEQGPEAKGV
jgi:hypothetical protein